MMWKEKEHFNSVDEMMKARISDEEMNDTTSYAIPNTKRGAELIKTAIASNKKIYCFGDYDCDGIMGTAIMVFLFKYLNYPITTYIPRRFSDGYGLSEKLIDIVEPNSFVITVDNGIASHDAIKKAKEKGCTILLTDHHLGVKENGEVILPIADCVINPCAYDGTDKELPYFHAFCGATVAYKLASELIDNEKVLNALETLAGIATIADVMPLKHENRQIVIRTINRLENMKSVYGINCLIHALDLENITSEDIGFRLGPIINASGRMYDDGATRILDLITSPKNPAVNGVDCHANPAPNSVGCHVNNGIEVKVKDAIATNEKRKEMQKKCISEVTNAIKENHMENDFPMVVYHKGIPEGLIGIVAGRLAEDYKTPCLVFSDTEVDGVLKGSGRSYGDVHLKDLLDKVSYCFTRYGGHAGAAGMGIMKDQLGVLIQNIQKEIVKMGYQKQNYNYYDMEIEEQEIPHVIEVLNKYEPFGEGNPKPIFKIHNFAISLSKGGAILFNNHLKFMGQNINAIKFNVNDEDVPDLKNLSLEWDMYGQLHQNWYNGVCYNQILLTDYIPLREKETPRLLKTLSKISENEHF